MPEALPRLLLIADGCTDPERANRVVQAVRAGVGWVQLRDHAAPDSAFADAAFRLVKRLRTLTREILITMNTRVEVARELDAGVHLGHRGPSAAEARRHLGPGACLGVSAHDSVEGLAAVHADVDYLTFSPVFPTSSKPGHPGVGIDALASFCEAMAPTPVYALGGITPERVASCRAAGARGVAVLSGIMDATDPAAAADAYLRALSSHIHSSPKI